MKFCLLLIAAASATTIRQMDSKTWPGAYRENNNDGVDVKFDQNSHTTPPMITSNRAMPAEANKGNARAEPLYPYNTKAAQAAYAPKV